MESELNGRVKEQDNSDGTKDIYAYDAVGQLIRQQVVKGENVISYINYTYDEAGNVISKESSQQEGNIATISSVTMTYDKANRIKTYNGETVTYDKEGNMTYGPSTEGIMTEYTYNCRNQLIQADNVTYAYDAEGNRTAQIDLETGTRTEYTNNTNGDLTQVVLETATCGGKTTTTTYVYGNGLISQNNSDGYLTFHYNNIGSTIVLTNEEGEAEEQYTYGPYGEILSGDTSKTAYLYNGMYGVSTDANGLYYMRARYYNVSIKRFLNQDIVNGSITNSQSLNKFSYIQGNPISLTDPFGLSPNISISGIGHATLDLYVVDVITLGVSVAGMGMAGASIAKSGKSLKAMYKGKKVVSNVATSNATKGVSAIAENAGPRKMDLQMFGGKSGSNFKGQLYNGTRNPDVDFVNGKGKSILNKHAGKHGYTSPEEYLKDARNFLEKKPTSTIQSFVSNEGTYFRYDTATNEFGIINEYGGISTYFKPENGMAYWLEQIEKYAPK